MKEYFDLTLQGPWTVSGDDVRHRFERQGDTGYLVFPPTWDDHGWVHNFDFMAVAYKRMKVPFLAHRGFLALYHSIRDELVSKVARAVGEGMTWLNILGYSQGGALATLAHEDMGFNFAGLAVKTNAFGSPLVLWMPPETVRWRFADLTRWVVRGDIVSTVPPWIMGFRHVGRETLLGPPSMPCAKSHERESYRTLLP